VIDIDFILFLSVIFSGQIGSPNIDIADVYCFKKAPRRRRRGGGGVCLINPSPTPVTQVLLSIDSTNIGENRNCTLWQKVQSVWVYFRNRRSATQVPKNTLLISLITIQYA
jgi:hypothetical protein